MGQYRDLDPEIASEGESADEPFQPFITRPVIPTYEGLKSLVKYFPQFSGIPYKHQAFPCWLYHPTLPPVLVRTEQRAQEHFGVRWRKTTYEEKAAGFVGDMRWEYEPETQWRTVPYDTSFNPMKPDTGKEVVLGPPRQQSQSEMITAITTAVLAAMGMQRGGGNALAAAPVASSDPDYAEFLEFKRWKASQQPAPPTQDLTLQPDALNEAPRPPTKSLLTEAEERTLLEEAAAERNIKLKPNWSIDRVKDELAKFGNNE